MYFAFVPLQQYPLTFSVNSVLIPLINPSKWQYLSTVGTGAGITSCSIHELTPSVNAIAPNKINLMFFIFAALSCFLKQGNATESYNEFMKKQISRCLNPLKLKREARDMALPRIKKRFQFVHFPMKRCSSHRNASRHCAGFRVGYRRPFLD